MKKNLSALLLLTLICSFTACDSNKKPTSPDTAVVSETVQKEIPKVVDKATEILQAAIKAHGGIISYSTAHYQFVFRGKTYTFKTGGNGYTYTVESVKDGRNIKDIIQNEKFSRQVNSKTVAIPEKEKNSAKSALNSVIYFATLPYKLGDVSVNESYVEETTIKGKKYDVLKVTFDQEGGGEDFEDEYHYWINQETKKIDYLAYNYHVNGGGVRFRSAYNVRVVDGITFQDYINYKAEVGTPLKDLPALYEKGSLKELSRIETENVINLNK
ncbi:MAG: DUF6503 family protein [Bacteroidota bacterium]